MTHSWCWNAKILSKLVIMQQQRVIVCFKKIIQYLNAYFPNTVGQYCILEPPSHWYWPWKLIWSVSLLCHQHISSCIVWLIFIWVFSACCPTGQNVCAPLDPRVCGALKRARCIQIESVVTSSDFMFVLFFLVLRGFFTSAPGNHLVWSGPAHFLFRLPQVAVLGLRPGWDESWVCSRNRRVSRLLGCSSVFQPFLSHCDVFTLKTTNQKYYKMIMTI